ASGGSAGGHLAAATGTVDDFTGPEEDHAISTRPNAMVLFNPGFDVASSDPRKPQNTATPGVYYGVPLGADPKKLSPIFQIKSGLAPMIVFHGKADKGIYYDKSEAFVKATKAAGNRCELIGYEGAPHGFFNWGAFDNKYFVETMRVTDEFLISLKYLSGKPTIDQFLKTDPTSKPK
ncbi:MAG: alpha/beta hydrolase fold domain-containing protein, partial [Phycisphaerales bacterium]